MIEAAAATPSSLVDIDAVVLAGGLGTRVRAVLGDTPKVLAKVGNRTYIDSLLYWLRDQGVGRVFLCLGHLAGRVEEHLARRVYGSLRIETIVESRPLGTGGAIRNACPRLRGDPVLVMNGDTMVDAPLQPFLAAHRASGREISLLAMPVDDVSPFGSIVLDDDGMIVRFVEKNPSASGAGLVSGGVYFFSQTALRLLAEVAGPSLERDFLQTRPPGYIHGYLANGAQFFDLGTRENLARATSALPESWRAALPEAEE